MASRHYCSTKPRSCAAQSAALEAGNSRGSREVGDMVVLLAVILVVVIAFSLFTARSLYKARDVRRLKAREEAEMIEVTGQWIIQGRAASRPVRSARRPYKMPT